jgi:hypothetical protein
MSIFSRYFHEVNAMEPRLKTSTKWSPFPDELIGQIVEVFRQSFEDYDLDGQFIAEGAIYPEELLLRVGLTKNNQLRQRNFEASIQYNSEEEKPLEKIHVLVDFLGQVWESYLEDEPEDAEMSLVWVEERFKKESVFLKFSTVNSNLEKQADQLLEMFEKKLLHEGEENEDPLAAFDEENFSNKYSESDTTDDGPAVH